jgi:hypothetical protein
MWTALFLNREPARALMAQAQPGVQAAMDSMRACFILQLFSFQLCAILWWQKIASLQKRVSRNPRHFMVRKWRISSLLKRDK